MSVAMTFWNLIPRREASRGRRRTIYPRSRSALADMVSTGRRRGCFEQLESRTLLNAGGGFANAGIQGEYYASAAALPGTPVAAPYGSPTFTRQDVRIDFDWGMTGQPGGFPGAASASVGLDNFSVLWTGEVIPKFSETYTFTVTTVGGDMLFIRPQGSSTWTTLVNDWTVHGVTADTATYSFTAAQTYDIEMQYRQPTAGAAPECVLQWSSLSTPIEAIEPAAPVGLNLDGGDAAFANMVNGGTRNYWWVPGNTSQYGGHRQQLLAHGRCRVVPRRGRYDARFRGNLPDPVQRHGQGNELAANRAVLGRRHRLRQHPARRGRLQQQHRH